MTPLVVTIERAARRALVEHARRDRPRECCGFLLGAGPHVSHAAAMPNVAAGKTRFRVSDRDHLELRRVIRRWSPPVAIVGTYHSHPGGSAWPSETDIAEAHYPDWIHVIVGLHPRLSVRAFRLPGIDSGGSIERLTLRLVSSPAGRPVAP